MRLRASNALAFGSAATISILIFCFAATQALGLTPLLGKFGGSGSVGLKVPIGIGVARSDGNVYVADAAGNRISKYDALGKFILTIGGEVNEVTGSNVCTGMSGDSCKTGESGVAGGFFGIPTGIAVDPASEDIYVMDFGNDRVQKFGPSGEFILMFGGEVDTTTGGDVCSATSGDTCQAGSVGTGTGQFGGLALGNTIAVGPGGAVYVGDENRIEKFDSRGVFQSEVSLPGAGQTTALAVASNGDLYVKSSSLNGVRKYDPSGTLIETLDESGSPEAIGIDTNDNLLVDDSTGETHFLEYDPTGSLLSEFGSGLGVGASLGIAADDLFTDIYVTDRTNNEVVIFGPPPKIPPSIDSESVAELGEKDTSVKASIDPDLLDTTYYVRFGTDTSYSGGQVPVAPGSDLGGDGVNAYSSVTVFLEGLEPNTTYHFQFVAISSAGTVEGQDRVFRTYPVSSNELPDGRVYEQVSPVEKNGNEAGASDRGGSDTVFYGIAQADGDGVLFGGTGPFGTTFSGASQIFVARRSEEGWTTRAALPPGYGANAANFFAQRPGFIDPSADLSHLLFTAGGSFVKNLPTIGGTSTSNKSEAAYIAGEDMSAEPSWLSVPQVAFSSALPEPGHIEIPSSMAIVGGSPDLSTAYFTYFGTLLPEDTGRGANFESGGNGPWGFYEWKNGVNKLVGELPDKTYDPFGAVPAVTLAHSFIGLFVPDNFNNEISVDGSRALFVSPDPESAHPGSDPPELYVRESGRSTVLVSRDTLLPSVAGQPAAAPGPEAISPWTTPDACGGGCVTYAYASPDGSHVFFHSAEKLALDASGEEPTGSGPWTYDFDVDSGSLIYLPGVDGPILGSSQDGTKFIFENSSPHELAIWSTGEITEVAEWMHPASAWIAPVRMTPDGKDVVFETNAVAEQGQFNNFPSHLQIYNYDLFDKTLNCISCPPLGITPSGDAHMSNDDEQIKSDVTGEGKERIAGSRDISPDGGRIFFDTPEPLVSRDINGRRDVYEWENGQAYLISSGRGPSPSVFIDNSESGNDIFFATTDSLVEGDTDGSFDVYDARVGGGFAHSLPEAECGICQLFTAPPPSPLFVSQSVGVSGNLTSPSAEKKVAKKPAKKKKPIKHKRKKPKKRSKNKRASRLKKSSKKKDTKGEASAESSHERATQAGGRL